MSIVSDIRNFLKGNGSYSEGCFLFMQITTNQPLVARLLGAQTEAHEELLRYELDKFLQSQPGYWEQYTSELFDDAEPVIEPTIAIDIHSIVTSASKPVDNPLQNEPEAIITENPIITRIKTLRKPFYTNRGHLHGQLHEAQTNERRHEIAKELLSCERQLTSYNLDIRKVETGNIPAKYFAQDSKLTADEFKRINNLKSYIRRLKNDLKKADTSAKREKILSKLDKYTEELKTYSNGQSGWATESKIN